MSDKICRSYTKRLFVRVNHENELYFSKISFQTEANGIYVSEINIVLFKRRSIYFRSNKWNICSTNFYKTYKNSKFTISNLRSETKNMWIWKPMYEKSLTSLKGLTFRSNGFGLNILMYFLTRAKQKENRAESCDAEKRGGFSGNTHTNIIIIHYRRKLCVRCLWALLKITADFEPRYLSEKSR